MEFERPAKRIMFITGPLEVIEHKLNEIPGDWIATEFIHHVIKDAPHMTIVLLAGSEIRRAQLAQGIHDPRRGN